MQIHNAIQFNFLSNIFLQNFLRLKIPYFILILK